MELLAAIMALKKIKSNSDVIIFTDSIYVKNGITEWMVNWKKNGWKNSNKKPVKNKDLWIKLDILCEKIMFLGSGLKDTLLINTIT